jgi:hypothetical protein
MFRDGEWFVVPVENEEYAKYVAYVLTRAFQRRMLYSYGVPYQVMLIDVKVEKNKKRRDERETWRTPACAP